MEMGQIHDSPEIREKKSLPFSLGLKERLFVYVQVYIRTGNEGAENEKQRKMFAGPWGKGHIKIKIIR